MKILFLLPYPIGRAPSQRFRVEMLLPLLDDAGIQYKLCPFITDETWNILYKGGSAIQKAKGIIKGYLKRVRTILIEARNYDYIFIHREAAPLGPPVLEWYLAKVLCKCIIYDLDDAIWIPNTSAENRISDRFKAFWKVPIICKWSKVISAGNHYLCAFAKANSDARIVRMPTVVDTINRYNRLKKHHSNKITIGWTGSHSTLKYLDELIPVIQKLQEKLDFTFLVIADKKPQLNLKDWTFLPWNTRTEIDDLLKIDVGLMPLAEDEWAEGKCGFKLIQYLSLGIPAVAGPAGVNKNIIEDGVNGYICLSPDEWYSNIKKLILNVELREDMGRKGQEKIRNNYSIESNKNNFLSLFH